MIFYPPETWVANLTVVRRQRFLPVRGEVLARVGDRVESVDVVARAVLPGKLHLVDVQRALNLRPGEVEKHLLKDVGDEVRAGEALAVKGLLRRACRSPVSGVVVAIQGGRVLIEEPGEVLEIRANLRGRVVAIMPEYGVVVETVGALVQGVWGDGGEASGVIRPVAQEPAQPLREEDIDISCQGGILIGGSTVDETALRQAVQMQVHGVVVGSIDSSLQEVIAQLPFPVMVTEGFGESPMSTAIFQLLKEYEGREALLRDGRDEAWGKGRPELVIPMAAGASAPQPPSPGEPLAVGAQVRVIAGPHRAATGQVTALRSQATLPETGARLPAAEVTTDDGQTLIVPWMNLEILRS